MSAGLVIFMLRSEPSTTCTSWPMRSTRPASSEAFTPSDCARAIAAFDHAHGLLELLLCDALFEALHFIAARGDDEVGHQRAGSDAPQAENHDGRAVQLEELLGRLRAHARSHAGSRQNGSDSTHIGSGIRLCAPRRNRKSLSLPQAGVWGECWSGW